MDEELLVRHCAPTLAGLKTANLFSCTCENRETLRQHLQRLNRDFVKKGLCALPLRCRNGKALIYVYRPQRLREDLKDREAGEILRRQGYGDQQPGRCLNRLIHRLQDSQDVPHEIGLFLGYPPEDVEGFMERRKPCPCAGPWRVYGDAEKAQALFQRYRRCTRIYCEQWSRGKSIDQLTVSSREAELLN